MEQQRYGSGLRLFNLLIVGLSLVAVGRNANAQAAKGSPDPSSFSRPAAVVDGKSISEHEVESMARNQLMALKTEEYNLKRRALDDAIDRVLLEKEAARRGTNVQALTLAEVDGKVPPVRAEEIKAVYHASKQRFADKSEAEAGKLIESYLRQARINARRRQFLKDLRGKAEVQVYLDPPRVKVDAGDAPFRGPKTAPVTIVEFTEFQCPFCASAASTLRQIAVRYREKVRIVFRDFPLAIHDDAPKAAEAAACANDQGKFWEMHDKLFANQSKLKVADLKRYAGEVGLDPDRFNQCLDSGKHANKWHQDVADGLGYGVTGTPTFFINGRILSGALPLDELASVIDDELQR
jgi:protein-disulfide isomerase